MRKLQFILMEIINDMGISKGTLLEWISTLVLAIVVFEFRMIIHYGGQWVFLKFVNAPVTNVHFDWYEIKMDYAYWNMRQQLGVIMAGPLSNTILFLFFVLVNVLSNRYIQCFPVKFCKFIAWYGLATCLDFFLISVVDMAN